MSSFDTDYYNIIIYTLTISVQGHAGCLTKNLLLN